MIDLFGIPLSSILLFTLAGILIGHLLWYHDRSGDTEKMNGLENRYFKARGSARQRKREFLKLQKNSESNQTDLEGLREEHAAALQRQAELEQSLAELKQLRLAKQQTDDTLAAEQKRSESLVAQLQEVLQAKTAAEQDLAAQGETVAELQATRQEMESEIQQLRSGLSSQAESAQNVLKTIDDLQTVKQTQSQEITQLRQANQQFEDQIGQLSSSLEIKTAETDESSARDQQSITELRSEVESLRAAVDQATETLTHTQQDLVARCEDLDEIRAERDDLKEQHHEASQRAENLNTELSLAQIVKTERDEFAADLETAANSLAQQRQTLELREAELSQVKAELQHVQQELSAMSEQLKQHLEDKQTLSTCIVDRDAEVETMRTQIEELIPLRSEVVESNLQLVEQKAETAKRDELIAKQRLELESVTAEFNQSALRYQSLQAEFEQSQVQLRQSDQRIKELEPLQLQLVEAGEAMEKQREIGTNLNNQCAAQSAEIERLTSESDKIPVLVQQLDEVQTKLIDLGEENEQQRTTINLLSTNLDSTKERLESVSKELVTVSNERDTLSTTRADLEQAVTNLQNQVASQSAKVKEISELLSVKTEEHSQAAATLQQQIETQSVKVKEVTELLSVKSHEHSQTEAGLQQKIQSQSTALEDLRKELAAKSQQHDHVLGKFTSTTQKLDQLQAAFEKLTSELAHAEKLRPENKTLQDRIADLMAHLKRLSGELDDSLDANAKGQDRIRDLESQLHDHTVKLRDLHRQRGSIAGLDDQQDDSGRQAA